MKLALHVAVHEIPAGEEVTEPLPWPDTLTETGTDVDEKVAVTVFDVPMTTSHLVGSPCTGVQFSDQPTNV